MWQEHQNALQRTFKFKDFVAAFSFMTEVAFHAELRQHHPNWTNIWNTVYISLNTHDEGNIVTDKDRELAAIIDQVFEKFVQ